MVDAIGAKAGEKREMRANGRRNNVESSNQWGWGHRRRTEQNCAAAKEKYIKKRHDCRCNLFCCAQLMIKSRVFLKDPVQQIILHKREEFFSLFVV